MKRVIVGLLVILSLVLTGCCNCPVTPEKVPEVVCDNQDIWNHRAEIAEFKCVCDNSNCRDFPVTRRCSAGMWVTENSTAKYHTENIVCTEVYR